MKPSGQGEDEGPLGESDKSQYRALVARASYLSQDRGGIQFAVKEFSRKMSCPSNPDWIALKRLGSSLVGKPRAVSHFKYQSTLNAILKYL